MERIAILDLDVHHGDSTQRIFYDDPRVLFISIHWYLDGFFYPGKSGAMENLGEDRGLNFNLNFPLNPESDRSYIGDQEYLYIYNRFVEPVLKQFNPQFVFVSAGFDCMG